MTCEELIGINAQRQLPECLEFSPEAIVVVSNPMDTMTYLAFEIYWITKE
jgi:malate/lactate dehydrogenase